MGHLDSSLPCSKRHSFLKNPQGCPSAYLLLLPSLGLQKPALQRSSIVMVLRMMETFQKSEQVYGVLQLNLK